MVTGGASEVAPALASRLTAAGALVVVSDADGSDRAALPTLLESVVAEHGSLGYVFQTP